MPAAVLRERLLLELTTKEDASGGPSSRSRWATVALGGGGGGAVRCAAAPGRPLTGYGAAGPAASLGRHLRWGEWVRPARRHRRSVLADRPQLLPSGASWRAW